MMLAPTPCCQLFLSPLACLILPDLMSHGLAVIVVLVLAHWNKDQQTRSPFLVAARPHSPLVPAMRVAYANAQCTC